MSYISNRTLLTLLFFFIFINPSISDEKIAFVDIDYIIQNSVIGKKMISNINKLDKKNIDNLKKKNKTLKDLELAIKNKKNIISEEAFNNEVISFRKKAQEFEKEKNQIVNDFNNYKKEEFQKIFKEITPIISNYIDENSVTLLFDSKNIFMGAKEVNLTEDILKKINMELK